MTSSPDPSTLGEGLTFTASLTGDPWVDGADITGTVTFMDGAVVLGEASVVAEPTASGKSYSASVQTAALSAGDHNITAVYGGDSNYRGSTSPLHIHAVDPLLRRKLWMGGSGMFSNPASWSPAGVPEATDSLVFGPGDPDVPLEPVDDLPTLTVAHVSFSGPQFTFVRGQTNSEAVTVNGGVYSAAAINQGLTVQVDLPPGQHALDTFGGLVLGPTHGPGGIRTTGGFVYLSSINDYAGLTDVVSGEVVSAVWGLGTTEVGTVVHDGASLGFTGVGETDEPLDLTGTGFAGRTTVVGSGNTNLYGPVTVHGPEVSLSDLNVHSGISGPSGLAIANVALSGTNTFSGGLRLVGLGLLANDKAAGSGVITQDGGRLTLIAPVAIANQLVFSGGDPYRDLEVIGNGGVDLTGTVTIGGRTTVSVIETCTAALSGAVTGPGSLRLTGLGHITLSGVDANSVAGGVQIDTAAKVTSEKPVGVDAIGAAGVDIEDAGSLVLGGDDQLADGAPVTLRGATATFDASGHSDSIGQLSSGGAIRLGDVASPDYSILTTSGVALSDTSTIRFALGGTNPGVNQDQLRTPGGVSIAGSLLVDTAGDPPTTSPMTIIDNEGSGPISGTFHDLPEGSNVYVGRTAYTVSYHGGDGNDVTLTYQRAPAPPPPPPPTQRRDGYWMLGSSGSVYAFGDAEWMGNDEGSSRATSIAATPTGRGYWIVAADGKVSALGDAGWLGDRPPLAPGEVVASIATTPTGRGYWLFTSHGRAHAYGDAQWFGDMTGTQLNGPVLWSIATPSGRGYYLVAGDGGIFAFGDAQFRGSMGGRHLNGPVVGLAPDPDGTGYWLVASDGGIFAFDAAFRGSMGGQPLNKPVVSMVAYGDGYLMVAADGGIFDFSSVAFAGSLGASPPAVPIVAVAPWPA